MSNPQIPTFVPHTSEDDLGYSGSWRGLLSAEVIERGIKLQSLGKQTKEADTTGVLMPSFDWSMNPADPAFLNSVAPHMSSTVDPKKTVHFVPNAWGTPFRVFTFLGDLSEHFFSPSNRSKMLGWHPGRDPDLLADAFDDIHTFIKRNQQFDAQSKDYYLKAEDFKTGARMPSSERKFFSNMLIRDKDRANDTHVIELYTPSAHTYFIDQMRWATRFGGTPVDPKWPAYLIGDPTDPAGALVWNQQKVMIGKQESNVMCFTKQPEQIEANPARRPISAEQLAARVNLYDEATWNWPTYQEMVDFAVEVFTEVPRDLIADACGHRATVPQRKKATVVDGGGAPRSGVGAAGPSSAPPESSVASKDPTPPPASQPVTPVAEASMWVIGPATGGVAAKWTTTAIRDFAASGKMTSEKVNIDGTATGWKSFAEAGFVAAPVAPVEVAPEAPPAPPAEAAPAAPASEAPTPPGSELQAAIDQSVPTYHSMTPEKQAQVRGVMTQILAHRASNPGVVGTPPELAMQLGTIMMG